MKTPVAYQGGKARLAAKIIERIGMPCDGLFYDVCCGSGAVGIQAVLSGQPPTRVVMVDASPWGLFWSMIGNGSFDVQRFGALCAAIPADPRFIKPHIEALFRDKPGDDLVYVFLLLQAAAVGGCPIDWDGESWKRTSGFRDYWQPTSASKRRSPVNPMMPMPKTILERVRGLSDLMRGVIGVHGGAESVAYERGVVYVDPPYSGRSGYFYGLDVDDFARSISVPVWVSEGFALTSESYLISSPRAKGGVTGLRSRPANEEWLSLYS